MKFIQMTGVFLFVLALSFLMGCSVQDFSTENGGSIALQPEPGNNEVYGNEVIKARASIAVVPGDHDQSVASVADVFQAMNVSDKIPIDIINAPNTTIKFDTSKFKIPAISNALLSFGTIALSALTDNVLNVCGNNKKAQCTKAFIRFYTAGVKGAGVWNAEGGYGMPVFAAVGNKSTVVGLNSENAAYMAQLTIPSTTHVLTLADFASATQYALSSDFKTAGAGSYSTTLIIEYGLAD